MRNSIEAQPEGGMHRTNHDSTFADAILETVGLPLLALDADLRVEVANDAFLRHFQVTRGETVGRLVYELGNGQWNIPELRSLLEDILRRESWIEDYLVEHTFAQIGHRIMRLNAKRIHRPKAKDSILLAIADETEREKLRAELEGRTEFADKLIDSVREGLLILRSDLSIHSANQSFYEMFKVRPAETVGHPISQLGNGQWNIPELRRLLEDILPREKSFDDYKVEHDFDGLGRRIMLLNGRRLDHIDFIILAIRDVTAQHDEELARTRVEAALRESECKLTRKLVDTKRLQELGGVLIEEGRVEKLYEHILDAAMAIMQADFGSMQMLDEEQKELRLLAWRNFHPDSAKYWRTVSTGTGATCGIALQHRERIVVPDVRAAAFLQGSASQEYWALSGIVAVQSTPLMTREGRMIGMLSTHWREVHMPDEGELRLFDILARQAADCIERSRAGAALRESERHLHVLLREVNHRSKNMLSLVQAIARQTVAASPDEFLDRFFLRIQALAAGQDLLVKAQWRGVAFAELVRSQLAHFQDLIGTRIKVDGPPLLVSPAAAQSLGMALHELATNAGKYGSLSSTTGGVRIAWSFEPAGAGKEIFSLDWRELDGPPVAPPAGDGFGSTVTGLLLESSLHAKVDREFGKTGLTWRLRCPAAGIVEGTRSAPVAGIAIRTAAS